MSSSPFRPPQPALKAGFTLVELLVAIVILAFVMGLVLSMTQQTSVIWKKTTGKIEGLRDSRVAFESMTRTLSQATLNTYYDYFDSAGNPSSSTSYSGTPATYGRQSNLQFVSGPGSTLLSSVSSYYTAGTHAVFFQAPLGTVSSADASPTTSTGLGAMNGLLNACGFYIVYGPDPQVPSFLQVATPAVAPRYRYRLMEFVQPSESLSIYSPGIWGTPKWFYNSIYADLGSPTTAATSDYVLAENVIALIILPKISAKDETALGLTGVPIGTALVGPSAFSYDSSTLGQKGVNAYLNSKNQLPPVVQVTMVAIDEASAIRLGNSTTPPDTKVGLGPNIFTQSQNLQSDLTAMENTLVGAHLNYRVFQTDVALRSAKWTVSQ